MLNNKLSISFAKRIVLFSLLILLLLVAYPNPQTARLDNTKLTLTQAQQAIYKTPADKLHNFAIVDGSLLCATNLGLLTFDGQKWKQLLGEETFAVKVINENLIIGTREGIKISTDGGKNWYLSNEGLAKGLVPLAIEVTQADKTIYIGTDRHGVFRSIDSGKSWQASNKGLPPSIGVNPFAVVKRLSISPDNPNLLFAATDSDGLYLSFNGGENWQAAKLNLPGAFSHRVIPPFISFDKESQSIYTLVNFPIHSHLLENRVYKSIDNGQSWDLIGKLEANQNFYDFSVTNNVATVRTNKELKTIDLNKLAEETRRSFLTLSSIQPLATSVPGTEPDYEINDLAVLHDDGSFTSFFEQNLTGFGREITKRFYQRHGDDYDIIVTFLDPDYGFPFAAGAVAYNAPIQNQVGGIGRSTGVFNGGPSAYGSKGRLRAFCNLNLISQYPNNFNESFFFTNSAVDVLSHEIGHTWSAFLNFDDNGLTSDELLGRQLAHWSFFFNSGSSQLEGNSYQDLGNGNFRINGATSRYNDFDLYAMGLSSGVGNAFIVSSPTNIDPQLTLDGVNPLDISLLENRGLPPLAPPDFPTLTVTGTRKNVTLADVTKVEGPRIPSQESGNLKIAFVLIAPPGKEPKDQTIEQVNNLRKAWISQFSSITNNRRKVDSSIAFQGGSDTTPPQIVVKGPSGGDVVPAGAIITISWDSKDNNTIAKHDILMSLDGGQTFPIEVAKLLNGTTQEFDYALPPELFSSNASIKVIAVDHAGNRADDTTDIAFQIERETTPPTVKVNNPNGGEQILAGSPYLITWTSTDNGMLQSHDVNVSLDGGKTFRSIFSGIPGRTQSFIWQVPADLVASDARIQVVAKDSVGNIGNDTSDKSFSIVPKDNTNPQVKLLSPLGGDNLQASGRFNITWTSSDNLKVASHELQLSTNGGQSFDTIIATGLSAATQNFIWQVPDLEITTARVRITVKDEQDNVGQDTTANLNITRRDVTAPTVRVISPNGTENINAGENLQINWQVSDNVAIQSQSISLSLDGGTSFSTTIADGLPANTNSFTFKLPDTIQSTQARIRVTAIDTANLAGSDVSDANFIINGKDTVAPKVTVVSPNGGEVIANSEPVKITWQVSDNLAVTSQDIQISLDGGVSYRTLNSGLAGNIQEFILDLKTLQSEQAKIKIVARDNQNNIGSDESNNVFALLAKPSILDVKYNSTSQNLNIFASGISANTTVEINGQAIQSTAKFKAKKGNLVLNGSLAVLNLRSGDNIILVKERGLVSGAFKLNIR